MVVGNEDNNIPSRRLFVSEFSSAMSESDLRKIFEQFGMITDIEILDESGDTAFLTYSTREETLTALLNKNNIFHKNQKLKICEATPKKTQLFVGGLKSEITNEMLMEKFSEYGDVYEANVKIDPRTGYSRCFGFVTFIDCDQVCKKLIERRFMEFDGKTIEVKKATPITDYFRQIKEKGSRGRSSNQNQMQMNMPQFQNPMYQLNQQMMQMSMMQGNQAFMMPMMNPMMVPVQAIPQQQMGAASGAPSNDNMLQQQQQQMMAMMQQQMAQQQQQLTSQAHQPHPQYSAMHSPPSPVQVKTNAHPLFIDNSTCSINSSSALSSASDDFIAPFYSNFE